MNRSAIDDLLGAVLSGWYRSVAEWAPPGRLSAHLCETCPSSLLAQAIDIAEWPHELIHELAGSLDTTLSQITESIAEDAVAEGGVANLAVAIDARLTQCLRAFVLASVVEHSVDIVDVLGECVEPRLADYVHDQTERALRDFAQQLGR